MNGAPATQACWLVRLGFLSPGRALQGKPVGRVEEPIADGVGDGGVREVVVPLRRRELAGHDRGPGARAIFEDFEEVAAILIPQTAEAPVVEDEDFGAGEAREGPLPNGAGYHERSR